jgi:hypothetical protein
MAYFCFYSHWSFYRNLKSPWGARGWSQFCKAKLLLGDCGAIPWALGAQGAGRNFASQNCCSPMQPGLQRKSRSACESTHEELERKARFFCGNPQKNAPKFRIQMKVYMRSLFLLFLAFTSFAERFVVPGPKAFRDAVGAVGEKL